MDKQFSHLLQLGRRGAERRFDELVNELNFLFASFPHLSESFDADEFGEDPEAEFERRFNT